MPTRTFRADIIQRDHFRFDLTFDNEQWPPVFVDEPEPLGAGARPNAARLLAGAVGNCLAASLLMCLEKVRIRPDFAGVEADVKGPESVSA